MGQTSGARVWWAVGGAAWAAALFVAAAWSAARLAAPTGWLACIAAVAAGELVLMTLTLDPLFRRASPVVVGSIKGAMGIVLVLAAAAAVWSGAG